jgi:putative nucleotidyltransferase with HDIG domain
MRQASQIAHHESTSAAEHLALSQVVAALSFALDLTHDAVPGHAVRTCLLGMRIGNSLGLNDSQLSDLYYSLLLKDVGCSSNAARMCQILGADERQAKRRTKAVDWTRPSLAVIRMTWANMPSGESLWRKTQRLLDLARNSQGNATEWMSLRCERGANIARKIGLGDPCADAIRSLDEHWNGTGYPMRLHGEQAPILARILAVAQHLDIFALEQGRTRSIDTLVERSGTWFDPELVRIAVSLDREATLWTGCRSHEVHARVMDLEPGATRVIDANQIDQLCEAFSDVVDAKSSFTYRHSIGVMDAANGIAEQLGLSPARTQTIRRAALLHDLGKLAVPNTILDKPGELNASEWTVVKRHPAISQQILERIPSFAPIATIAGRHHERLNGTGYPLGLKSDQLSLDDRIVSMADVYGTLSEERPYRPALPAEKVISIITSNAPQELDADCLEALVAFLQHQKQPPAQRPTLELSPTLAFQ